MHGDYGHFDLMFLYVRSINQYTNGNFGSIPFNFITTSGCAWLKATVKSPVGARDLRPVQPPRTLSAFMFGFVARFG